MEKAIKRYSPVFVLPTLLAFMIGFIIPFIQGLYLSFCQFTTVNNATFTGLSNYQSALADSSFLSSFKFTVMFAVASIVLINVIAFALALLLTRQLKGTNVFRTIFFMPNLIGGIVLGYIWQILINCTEQFRRILGTDHSHVLAADRLYDDHLYCRYSECIR